MPRSLGEPAGVLIQRYLRAGETVLVLQGAPGTGKTRHVRTILAALSRRKGESAEVMYIADMRALENDEIFVDFITGSHDDFVIEDADHLLKARSNCFAAVATRRLTQEEAGRLIARVCESDPEALRESLAAIPQMPRGGGATRRSTASHRARLHLIVLRVCAASSPKRGRRQTRERTSNDSGQRSASEGMPRAVDFDPTPMRTGELLLDSFAIVPHRVHGVDIGAGADK